MKMIKILKSFDYKYFLLIVFLVAAASPLFVFAYQYQYESNAQETVPTWCPNINKFVGCSACGVYASSFKVAGPIDTDVGCRRQYYSDGCYQDLCAVEEYYIMGRWYSYTDCTEAATNEVLSCKNSPVSTDECRIVYRDSNITYPLWFISLPIMG